MRALSAWISLALIATPALCSTARAELILPPPAWTGARHFSEPADSPRVCVDPGHPSFEGDKLYEAIINRKVAHLLADRLVELGHVVYITAGDLTADELFGRGFDNHGRPEQSRLEPAPPADRAELCNEWGADYMISIHHNYSIDPSTNHSLVLYGARDRAGGWSPRFPAAAEWARITAGELADSMAVDGAEAGKDQSEVGGSMTVLAESEMPAILTEASFWSNPGERARLDDDDYLAGEAAALCRAFGRFLEK
ncbi:MAG: N-acetylmuramoyl-L-alanine amidase [Polyangia bacterium]